MTPVFHSYTSNTAFAYVYALCFNGSLAHNQVVSYQDGLRPVINLKSNTKFIYNNETTKGSETDPYIVV